MPVPGELIEEKYELIKKIGTGGMAEVWLATHKIINKKVAVKFLIYKFIEQEEIYKRFIREAQACATLKHPNIIDIYDFGITKDGRPFIVMDYLEGNSLAALINQKQILTINETLEYVIQIAAGLALAHKKGIIHRDLKPENIYILVNDIGETIVKILDFGIAKITNPELKGEDKLTQTGFVFGTPYYMSPEQALGKTNFDHTVDIYALGVIMYQCLSGILPFLGDTHNEVLFKIYQGQYQPVSELRADLPEEVVFLIHKAMSYDSQSRYQSSLELKDALIEIKNKINQNGKDTFLSSRYKENPDNSETKSLHQDQEKFQQESIPLNDSFSVDAEENKTFFSKILKSNSKIYLIFIVIVIIMSGGTIFGIFYLDKINNQSTNQIVISKIKNKTINKIPDREQNKKLSIKNTDIKNNQDSINNFKNQDNTKNKKAAKMIQKTQTNQNNQKSTQNDKQHINNMDKIDNNEKVENNNHVIIDANNAAQKCMNSQDLLCCMKTILPSQINIKAIGECYELTGKMDYFCKVVSNIEPLYPNIFASIESDISQLCKTNSNQTQNNNQQQENDIERNEITNDQ